MSKNALLTKWTATVFTETGVYKHETYDQRLDAKVTENGDLIIIRTKPNMYAEPAIAAYAANNWNQLHFDSEEITKLKS